MPLTLIGFMSLALGVYTLVTGKLPVTEKRTWRGRRAKVVGWVCCGFGLLCLGTWVYVMFDKYLF